MMSEASKRDRVWRVVSELTLVGMKVDSVMEALTEFGVDINIWQDCAVSKGDARSENFDKRKIPPYDLYDERGDWIIGPLWDWEDVKIDAEFYLNEGAFRDIVEVQNYAGNTCGSFDLSDFGDEYGDDDDEDDN